MPNIPTRTVTTTATRCGVIVDSDMTWMQIHDLVSEHGCPCPDDCADYEFYRLEQAAQR